MRLIDRIFEYLSHKRLTPYTFERECGIANGYLQKQRKGKGTIGSEILEKISEKHSDLSLTWLITGNGTMLLNEPFTNAPISGRVSEAEGEYVSAQMVIRSLHDKIAILENALADKNKIIHLLESRS